MEKWASIYKEYENKENTSLEKYSFVFLDGSHDPEVVMKEVAYFLPRIEVGGSVVIDDTEQLGGKINPYMEKLSSDRFTLLGKTPEFKTTSTRQRVFIERIAE
jgi:hypothetical protein